MNQPNARLPLLLVLSLLAALPLRAQTPNPFDYSATITGGRILVSGGALNLVVTSAVLAGVPMAGDNGLDIALSGLPQGMTFSFPDIDGGGCCGTAPNYWLYGIGTAAGGAAGYLRLQAAATTPPGSYTLTLTTTAHLDRLVHTYPLTVTVLSAAQTTLVPQPFPAVTPVPSKALWESNMVTNGNRLCDQTSITTQGTYDGSVWYYDGERVFYQIGDYTGDPKWAATCAQWVDAIHLKTIQTNGSMQAYRIFTQGFRTDFQRTGNLQAKAAIHTLASTDGWWQNPGHSSSTDAIREAAYALESELDDEAVNGAVYPQDKALMESLLGTLDQMFITKSYTWYQPFMVGLACESLIKYFNEKSPDARIPWYVKQALDAMWNQAWNFADRQFEYRCYQDGCYTPGDDSQYPPTGTKEYPVGLTNLNLLIAPAYAWIFLKTGDPLYRERADLLFADGVQFSDIFRGKEFSQNYRWSFDYLTYRALATPASPGPQISAYYRLPGSSATPYKWLSLEPPQAFTVDAKGNPHLSVIQPAPIVTVRGEVPAKTAAGWDLVHIPSAGLSCYNNGLRQSPVDTAKPDGSIVKATFRQIGAKLISAVWQPGDVIQCDYEFNGPLN